jgi:hypothetical protein
MWGCTGSIAHLLDVDVIAMMGMSKATATGWLTITNQPGSQKSDRPSIGTSRSS